MVKINICGIPHEIKRVNTFPDLSEEDGLLLGSIDHTKAEISIRYGMPVELEKSTIMHEVLHGMLVQLGYNGLSEDETFVQGFSNAMYQMFDLKPGVILNEDKNT